MSRSSSTDPHDHGAVAIIVAVCAVVFFLIAALVVDLGLAMESRRDAQKAVDLAALAGGQELPDTDAATTAAAGYLIDNGWGTDADGNPLSAVDLIAALTDADDTNGDISFPEDTRLELTAPNRDVGFFFAPVGAVLGGGANTETAISARAVVEIRSVKNILPFQVPGGSQPGIQCIKNNTAAPCDDQTQGDFGLLDFPRTDTTGENPTIEKNIREGVQFTPTLIPNAEAVLAAALASTPPEKKCTSSPPDPAGAILLNYANPTDGFNCVAPGPGNKASVVADALVGQGGCNGRLAVPSGTPGAITIAGCLVSQDKFATYINPSSDLANYNSWGPISPSIVKDPRFGVLPVVASANLVTVSGGAKQVPIVRFYGSYYRVFYDNTGDPAPPSAKKNISAISAYVFPLDLIEGVAPNDTATIPYIGGAKIPVLVE